MRIASCRVGLIMGSVWTIVAFVLTSCAAAPPLEFYTLSSAPTRNDAAVNAADPPPEPGAPVIQIARVTLPAYLDTTDLVVRDGEVLERSSTGRWGSRLSVAATDLLTARLARRQPDAWVSDQVPVRPPAYRITVNISRLDITSTGTGTVEAEWNIVPHSASHQIVQGRTQFTLDGSVATDQGIVHLERSLLKRLADEIDIKTLR